MLLGVQQFLETPLQAHTSQVPSMYAWPLIKHTAPIANMDTYLGQQSAAADVHMFEDRRRHILQIACTICMGRLAVACFDADVEVGHIHFSQCPSSSDILQSPLACGNCWLLESMQVKPEYRRAGIATEMLRMALAKLNTNHSVLLLPTAQFQGPPITLHGREVFLTDDGQRFINGCMERGIFDKEGLVVVRLGATSQQESFLCQATQWAAALAANIG